MAPKAIKAASDAMKERALATEALDDKIEKFKEAVCAQGITDKPDLSMLKKWFTPSQMSCLWKRLQAARGKESMTITEAWDEINKKPAGAPSARKDVLMIFLSLEPGALRW